MDMYIAILPWFVTVYDVVPSGQFIQTCDVVPSTSAVDYVRWLHYKQDSLQGCFIAVHDFAVATTNQNEGMPDYAFTHRHKHYVEQAKGASFQFPIPIMSGARRHDNLGLICKWLVACLLLVYDTKQVHSNHPRSHHSSGRGHLEWNMRPWTRIFRSHDTPVLWTALTAVKLFPPELTEIQVIDSDSDCFVVVEVLILNQPCHFKV